jgi:hypothetical protein
MKKKLFLPVFLLLHSPLLNAQKDSIPVIKSPIVFSEMYFGPAGSDQINGLTMGANINYQHRDKLYSLSFSTILDLEPPPGSVQGPVIIDLPVIYKSLGSVSFLYGKRWIWPGHSISCSAGISENFFWRYRTDSTGNYNWFHSDNTGIALEANIKWFKKKKRPYHVYYGLIPVGRPTALGRSYGFKLFGNISKTWYAGIALSVGLGWHKKY